MTRLFLVRHTWSERNPKTPPPTWPLSSFGRDQAKKIPIPWPEIDTIVASSEAKTIETAKIASGRDPIVDPDFDEVRRPWTAAFSDALGDYFAGLLPHGWEPPEEAVKRAMSSIERHATGGSAAFVGNATILTLVVSAIEGADATYDQWSQIAYGGWSEIDWPKRFIVKRF